MIQRIPDARRNALLMDSLYRRREILASVAGVPPLELTGSVGKPLVSWSITGNTVQDGEPTPDNPCEVKMVGEKTGNLLSVNSLHVGVGESFKEINTDIDAGTYTISFDVTTTYTNDDMLLYIIFGDSSFQYLRYKHSGRSSLQISAKNTIKIIRFYSGNNYDSSKQEEATISNIMLNNGSTPLPYEPYGYKIPVVTTNNLIDFEKWKKYVLSTGVNKGVATFSKKSITLTATATDCYTFYSNYFPNVEVKPSTTYTLSWDSDSDISGSVYVFSNGTGSSYWAVNNRNVKSITFTTHPYTTFVRFRFGVYAVGTSITYSNIALCEGTQKTTPITTNLYLPTPLASGEVLRSTGEKDVKWGKIEMTGDELFSKNDANPDNYLYFCKRSFIGNVGMVHVLCSHLPETTSAPIYNIGIQATNSYDAVYFNFGKDVMDKYGNTTAGIKEFIKSQYEAGTPVTIYYLLATPTTEQIPNLPKIQTIKSTTIIDVDTEVKPESMTATYKK